MIFLIREFQWSWPIKQFYPLIFWAGESSPQKLTLDFGINKVAHLQTTPQGLKGQITPASFSNSPETCNPTDTYARRQYEKNLDDLRGEFSFSSVQQMNGIHTVYVN